MINRETLDGIEDHLNAIRTEWHVQRENWFCGENVDPVFEGVVRDFCTFDGQIRNIHQKVKDFMSGVEKFTVGLTSFSDGLSAGLAPVQDVHLASETCKIREATLQIARGDAPHSALAKLQRDLKFNLLDPVRNHISNNRDIKAILDTRRKRHLELVVAKKRFDACLQKNLSPTDQKYLQSKALLDTARTTFADVDRQVFEWLYILEEYRADILDSTLQTLRLLQYDFFAACAHLVSGALPARMEFRPLVEMTPEALEKQVEVELKEYEDDDPDDQVIIDFSTRLLEKKVREDSEEESAPAPTADLLSLSSLMTQGFEEGPARRALRLHQNDTQAALDWLVNGGCDEKSHKYNAPADGVRLPTSVKRVHRLKAMRKAQQLKLREEQKARRESRLRTEVPQTSLGAGPHDDSRDSSASNLRNEDRRKQFHDMDDCGNADIEEQRAHVRRELDLMHCETSDLLGFAETVQKPTVSRPVTSLLD